MHILLLDERLADRPCPDLEPLLPLLAVDGVRVSLCSPAAAPPATGLLSQNHGWPIRLDQLPTHSLAGSWTDFTTSLTNEGSSLTTAAARLTEMQQGLLRELIRRAVTTAVDETDVDVIFVCQAGILVEFAIETGPPVAAHADDVDLETLATAGRLKEIVAASLSSCELLAADTDATALALSTAWIEPDSERPIETWGFKAGLATPPLESTAARIRAACQTALSRRFAT